ncbi:MAG: histidine kinase dimerization/phospho-acceptor domain-containing protein [Hyphomicrobiales bacterium]|nr:histidine kinase dimerization/phospho-acceptor domain-containing protein [Hyphomicrobiales bacterium]
MPAWIRRILIFARSLRFKTLALLGGSALMAGATGFALIDGIRKADYYMERILASQGQLELLILLSGRVSDYAVALNELSQGPVENRTNLAVATSQVHAVFDRLDRSIEQQVALLDTDEAKNAEATESLSVARMRAMFKNLDEQIFKIYESKQGVEDKTLNAKRMVDVFGLGFAPMLAQAVEDERSEVSGTRRAMEELKRNLTLIATAVLTGALSLAALLYFGPVSSILRRTSEIVTGAKAVSSGRLDTRLPVKGHDEFALLMARFNRMAESLRRRERKLLNAQSHLQETVDARTAELRAANRRLEEIDQNRRRFFADVSHELRTPLTVILGEAEVTLRQANDKLPATLRKSVETIQARARRLNRRIEDLLRVARSESGRIDLNLSRMEVGAAVAEAFDDVSALARQRNMAVDLDVGPGDLHVNGDKDWLRQVFAGVIANAIKYSPAGERIAVKALSDGGSVRVEVSDNGCGIATDEMQQVFNRFFSGKNRPKNNESSHGVGLALAKWVIEEHRGAIALESPSRISRANGDGQNPGLSVIVSLNRIDMRAEGHNPQDRIS